MARKGRAIQWSACLVAVASANGCGGGGAGHGFLDGVIGGPIIDPPPPISQHAPSIQCADLDGDGDLDVGLVIDIGSSPGKVVVVLNTTTIVGAPQFAAGDSYEVDVAPGTLAIGDLDGDGLPDLAVGSALSPPTVSLLFNDPANPGHFLAPPRSFPASDGVQLALQIVDVDQDGRADLVAERPGAGATIYYQDPDAADGFRLELLDVGPDSACVVARDMNGDGWTDLCVSARGAIFVAYQDPTQPRSFRMTAYDSSAPGFTNRVSDRIAAAELNDDGAVDLVATRPDALGLLFQDPMQPEVLAPPVETVFTALEREAGAILVNDFDGDGGTDLCTMTTADSHSSEFALRLQDPLVPGTFLPPAFILTDEPAQSAASGDMDGDGLVDVIASGGSWFIFDFELLLQDPSHPGVLLRPILVSLW